MIPSAFHRYAAPAVAVVILIGACRDATVPEAVAPETAAIARRKGTSHVLTTENSVWKSLFEADSGADCYTRHFNSADTMGVSDGVNSPTCPAQMVVTPNPGDGTYSLWHSPTAVDGYGSSDSLVVTFSRPVGRLAILRDGTHSCYDTTIGQVVAYGPGNVELERKPFTLIQTCSDALPWLREEPTASSKGVPAAASAPYTSPYAAFAEAVLQVPSGVTRLVFLPPAEWYFTFVNPYFPSDSQHMMRQGTYSLIFRPDNLALSSALLVTCTPTAPVRRTEVHCIATMSDSSLFRPTRLRSSTAGATIVDSTLAPPTEQRSFDWFGPAIVATHVEVSGTAHGIDVHGEADFTIVTDTTFRDSVLPDPPPQLRAHGPPILLRDYPGFDSAGAMKGGLGRTMHLYPDYELTVVSRGPNRRLVYARWFKWTWGVPRAGEAPVRTGTYLSDALFPGDPFYRLQTGGRMRNGHVYCAAGDMDTLRGEVHAHESLHYRAGSRLREQYALPAYYEGASMLVPADSITQRTNVLFFLRSRAYMKALTASDNALDETDLATSLTCTMRLP